MDVTALGELLVDFTPAGISDQGNPLYERNPGGAPANVAACVARLGGKSAFIGKVGRDNFGSFLTDTLRDREVDCHNLLATDKASTTMAFVTLGENGDSSFTFARKPGADLLLKQEELDLKLIDESRVFHFGTLSMTASPARVATMAAAGWAQQCGDIVSFDPNYRPDLWPSEEAAKLMMFKGLEYADILKLSLNELEMLTGTGNLEEGTGKLAASNLKLIVVTLGPEGCFYRLGGTMGKLPTYQVNSIDTTGAGDSFWGAVLYQITRGSLDLSALSKERLEDILDFANAVGALVTTRRGCIAVQPGLEEVESFRQSGVKA